MKLSIIGGGSGEDTDLMSSLEARYVGSSLTPHYIFHFGTRKGAPGSILRETSAAVTGSKIIRFHTKKEEKRDEREGVHRYTGETKEDRRFNMIMGSDAVSPAATQKRPVVATSKPATMVARILI